MSQHDFNVANSDGATVRADINSALQAIAECSSGATAPSTTFAYQWWADTANDLLKQRNAANSAWISILTLSTGAVTTGGIASVAADTSPQLGGFLDANGNYMQTEKGGDITSASPLVIDTDGDYFDVTGTTNFAAMTVAADRQFTLQFDGVLTMTHHATNLDLPSEANITTAAGDVATFQSTGSNTVQCINYTKADGTGVVAAGGGKILQVVEGIYSSEASSSSSTYADTGLTVNITPSNTANKVLVFASVASCNKDEDTSGAALFLKLFRDATNISTHGSIGYTGDSSTRMDSGGTTLQKLDSPSTTSAVTYKVQFKSAGNVAQVRINMNDSDSSIVCMEIDGT